MGKSKSLRQSWTRISKYVELDEYARAFASGHLNLVLLVGGPGLGKSRKFQSAVGKKACRIDGNASAFGVYIQAYQHRDKPIILDDIDGLYRDRNGVRLLKSLCQTEPIKTVSWNTDAASLHREGIPKEFTTNSRVAIIANDWDSSNVNVAALEDRGHAIEFVPSSLEVHREAATWFWDQEIFDFVADHLHLIERPSLRTYVLAYELKNSNLDWKGGVMSRSLQGAALEVAKLKADTSYSSEEARVQAFIAAGEGCRATYFNYAKRLRDVSPIPKVELVNTRPPKLTVSSDQDLVDLLRKRFGQLGNG